jgi:ABC-type Na+ efflux pump permease subunit
MRNALFIAWHDIRQYLRQGSTLAWVFVMPPVFFYFIGTVTSGFSGTMSGELTTPVVVAAESPGFLRAQIDLRLKENGFETDWQSVPVADESGAKPTRILTLEDNFSNRIVAGDVVKVSYDTRASALLRQYEAIRIQRGLYTALADIVTADARSPGELTAAALIELNAESRVWQLDVGPAGERQVIPSGFQQAIPGILVMFTLLVLLTSGATTLVSERRQSLLRRLAYAPMSRAEVVAGKWAGRLVLAILQIASAVLIGTLVFDMNWGPDPLMIALVLVSWAAFCASAGLMLGNVARTEGQAGGLGVLAANVLAALGGCWWPIEVTPAWMQGLQNFLPTGWTMDALHKLISFEAGPSSALPYIALLLTGALLVSLITIKRFRYE